MSIDLPILYSFIRCPWAMRARMALCFMNIEYETREIDLRNKPEIFLQTSPKGTVPVLVLSDGNIIDESLDIVLWAMPKPQENYAEIMDLIKINDTDFKANNYNYKYAESMMQEEHRTKAEKFIQMLNVRLEQHTFLFNEQISIADLAIFPLVRQFSKVDSDWFENSGYVQVRDWIQNISNMPFFVKAMQKQPPFTN